MRLDRYKVKQRMEGIGIVHFKDLAVAAGINESTIYNTLDSHNWRSVTVENIARALECNPLELLTVDEI